MNIVTFCTAVSVATPKLWIVSLYYDTLTKDSFLETKTAVLQLLTPSQKHLVPLLGKKSGYEPGYSKQAACLELGFRWIDASEFTTGNSKIQVLPACAAYIQLKLRSTLEAGDHVVALCEVTRTGDWDASSESVVPASVDDAGGRMALDPSTALYTALLRQEGII
jgi:flavin reductase (DIM6/NTAB) family NADH-FMN oxidoreductase RutF